MAVEIKMPQLSDTMDAGKILVWHKKVGDQIQRGDILAEVETDKANLEIESFHQGVLLDVRIETDQTAKVGEIIAVIGQEGEEVPAGTSNTKTPAPTPAEAQPTAPVTPPPAAAPSATTPAATTPDIHVVPPPPPVAPSSNGGRIKASPLAKKIARQQNVDLTTVQGSGPHGRILKRDIDGTGSTSTPTASTTPQAPPQVIQAAPTPIPKPISGNGQESSLTAAPTPQEGITPLSKMRNTIAKRMQESVTTIPHFFTTISINMSEAKRARSMFKAKPEMASISINHLIIKAAAFALSKEPRVNCSLKEEGIYQPGAINIGMVTAIEDGLLIPVVKDADRLSLAEVAENARAAIKRAKSGTPSSDDLSGGTFSISNMGMFDVENFTAIISPGQGAILAISATIDTPVAVKGEVVVQPIMKATLSVDHRIIDGVMASNFLSSFKSALENPFIMI